MTEMEKLLEFLYVAPVALIEFDENGDIKLANPRVAQLFNRYAPGGYFQNFHLFIKEHLPELYTTIIEFDKERGQIVENKRYALIAPDGGEDAELWVDISVVRQEKDRFFASMNNVTEQVKVERQQFITEQKLHSFIQSINGHIVFTLNGTGVVNGWNQTGEHFIGTEDVVKGKLMSQFLDLSVDRNSQLLLNAQENTVSQDEVTFTDHEGQSHHSLLSVASITDPGKRHVGYSVVLSLCS